MRPAARIRASRKLIVKWFSHDGSIWCLVSFCLTYVEATVMRSIWDSWQYHRQAPCLTESPNFTWVFLMIGCMSSVDSFTRLRISNWTGYGNRPIQKRVKKERCKKHWLMRTHTRHITNINYIWNLKHAWQNYTQMLHFKFCVLQK